MAKTTPPSPPTVDMDTIINLCKSRGFVFPGSEIYDGLANTWDFGPLGVELKNHIKQLWWREFVTTNDHSVGLDGGILMNPNVWVASGHVGGFADPLMDCKACQTRSRADKLIESHDPKINADGWSNAELEKYIQTHQLTCPHCGKFAWTPIRQFNLMFATHRGVTQDKTDQIYLRPETAQSEYINFANVQRSLRLKVPFGIGQIGKAFRNEITPGNFIFRTVEFEQMEHQLFCHADDAMAQYAKYKQKIWHFVTDVLGVRAANLRFHDHEKLVFYAQAACDMEYLFPFGWGELNGTHHRGVHDLTSHQNLSKKSLEYLDPVTNQKFLPTVIESSQGVERLFLAVLCDAYRTQTLPDGDTRVVLQLNPNLAPYQICVLPLQKKGLTATATQLYRQLQQQFAVTYDDAGSIGKRYRRQDEIGTPLCVTVDYDTLTDQAVTVRDRDTMEQTRVKIADLPAQVINILTTYNKTKNIL
ncbi:MAG: glycine--tRNA ligase [Prevotella sp.]|nr:glycine--tRNA ligase [Prevotella sp.]